MPTWLDIIIISVIEGITEFLPISSTGHMIITAKLLGLPQDDKALNAFLIIVQAGAILAVVTVFWKVILSWVVAWLNIFKKNDDSVHLTNRRQSMFVASAVIPFGVAGFFLKDIAKSLFSINVVAWALIIGGIFIIISEFLLKKIKLNEKEMDKFAFFAAIITGIGQCAALWPGFSRSAASIITARCLGFSRKSAAEISFLIGFPTLLGAAGYEAIKEYKYLTGDWIYYLIIGSFISWFTAVICIKGFILFLQKYSLNSFAYYRIILGFLILFFIM